MFHRDTCVSQLVVSMSLDLRAPPDVVVGRVATLFARFCVSCYIEDNCLGLHTQVPRNQV